MSQKMSEDMVLVFARSQQGGTRTGTHDTRLYTVAWVRQLEVDLAVWPLSNQDPYLALLRILFGFGRGLTMGLAACPILLE